MPASKDPLITRLGWSLFLNVAKEDIACVWPCKENISKFKEILKMYIVICLYPKRI